MIKTLKNLLKQDKERYTVPRKVQDVIPVRRIWKDGIFMTGGKFAKTYKFTDINYLVASREDKESMFLTYSELLNMVVRVLKADVFKPDVTGAGLQRYRIRDIADGHRGVHDLVSSKEERKGEQTERYG